MPTHTAVERRLDSTKITSALSSLLPAPAPASATPAAQPAGVAPSIGDMTKFLEAANLGQTPTTVEEEVRSGIVPGSAHPPSGGFTVAPELGATPTTIEEEERSGVVPPAPAPPAVAPAPVVATPPPAEPGTPAPAPVSSPISTTGMGITLEGDARKGFVDVLFASGAAEGNPSYWYTAQSDDGDLLEAAMKGLQNPDQRKAIVDYLFDAGLATGQREYWYENRGAEDKDLLATFSEGGPAGGGATGGPALSPLEQANQDRLDAALKAIGVDFDVDEAQLNAELGDLKDLFERSMARNVRDTELTIEDTGDQFIERGIFNSGFFAKGLARNLQPLADGRLDLLAALNPVAGKEGTQVRDIMSLIRQLAPAEASASANARLEAERNRLEMQQMIALFGAGLGGG